MAKCTKALYGMQKAARPQMPAWQKAVFGEVETDAKEESCDEDEPKAKKIRKKEQSAKILESP